MVLGILPADVSDQPSRSLSRLTAETVDYAAPPGLAYRLNQAANSTNLRASGPLSFLNTWTYKLGTEVLTPFGRQQLFDLGVSMRMKYGNLLEGFKDVSLSCSSSSTIIHFYTASTCHPDRVSRSYARKCDKFCARILWLATGG